MRGRLVGVIGGDSSYPALDELATEIGREIARNDAVLVCGGRGGVMANAARGAKEVGGFTVGILPGPSIYDCNPYIDFPIATNMGQARNAVIVQTAEVLIALAGNYGTLSEIALALKIGKGVVALEPQFDIPGVRIVKNPKSAVREALAMLGEKRSPTTEV
ncbi:MAG: TIGR00725 family protein [Syntrophobacteraceae bacterium]